MEEREMNEFAWTGLFLVTGTCFLGFNQLIRILDGGPVSIFSWVGISSLFMGLIHWARTNKKRPRRNTRKEWIS
ncbi:MAG TPA: hypothetical protein VLJ68_11440 [Chitinophagaceae bacterium]|nr:hypothetical protein [Chitinophagaceae bacterium]